MLDKWRDNLTPKPGTHDTEVGIGDPPKINMEEEILSYINLSGH